MSSTDLDLFEAGHSTNSENLPIISEELCQVLGDTEIKKM